MTDDIKTLNRVALLRALLARPEAVIAEQVLVARQRGAIPYGADLEELLVRNDNTFFSTADRLGVPRDELVRLWWTSGVVPVLKDLAAPHDGGFW